MHEVSKNLRLPGLLAMDRQELLGLKHCLWQGDVFPTCGIPLVLLRGTPELLLGL